MRIRNRLLKLKSLAIASTTPTLWVSTVAILAISFVALLGWATHWMILTSWLDYAIPISPLATQLSITCAVLLLAAARWPNRIPIRAAMAMLAGFAIFRSVRVLFWTTNTDRITELFFIQHLKIYPLVLIGKISPVTGLGFILVSLHLLLCAWGRWNAITRIAADLLAVGVFCIGGFSLMGYLLGTPLLYGGSIVPIALPMTILFLLLSIALTAHAPARSRILHLYLGNSTQAHLIRVFLPSLAVLMVLFSLIGKHLVPWMAQANPAIVDSLQAILVIAASTLLILLLAPKVGRELDAVYKALSESQSIAAAAFESTDGIVISNADCVILRVNRAFSQITGYSSEEAVGKKTNLLRSDRHDGRFYAAMWESILKEGSWSGEIWNRRKSGEVYPQWLSITAIRGADAEITRYVATFADITARKEAETQIWNLAFYDQLTHLPNRRLLFDRLQHAVVSSVRNRHNGAILFIDLDNFKTFNDTQGHSLGDQLLQQVALRLKASVRESDTVARLGGDEFVVMVEGLSGDEETSAAEVNRIGETILCRLEKSHTIGGHEHHTTVSVGATLFGESLRDIDEILKRADIAMYKAKAEGRNTMRFFDQNLESTVLQRASLEKDLRHGIANGELQLHYQPQWNSGGAIVGAEALVRWQSPSRGLVQPGDFISMAEETGLILPLGHSVMECACAQLASWAKDESTAHLTIAVNVSVRQFQQAGFETEILTLIESAHADPRKLKLELTESVLLTDVESVIAKMKMLNARGLTFSLDDFGTGYSSLSYLRSLPLSQLKIDRSFVNCLLDDSNCATIVRSIIALAQSFGLEVIAEGVETEEQRAVLDQLGCQTYQGYLLSKPLPVEDFLGFIRRHGCPK